MDEIMPGSSQGVGGVVGVAGVVGLVASSSSMLDALLVRGCVPTVLEIKKQMTFPCSL